MDMVEKVARACAKAARMPDEGWRAYTHIARAALEAMREPSDSMANIPADDAEDGVGAWTAADEDGYLSPRVCSLIWQAMITQALKEG